jgi:putative nucleotidyltransferase with HDIG domain
MHWYAKAYIWAVAVAAAVFLNALERPFVPRDIEALFSILAFVSVGCLAEAMAIDFRLGKGRQAKSSLAFLPFLSSLAIFPPATAVIIVMTVVAVSQILLRRNDLYRATFNISQAALAIGIAALTYQGVGHAPPEGQIVIPGFVIASAVFFGSNILLNSIAIAILRSEDLSVVLRQVAGTKGGNLWYDLLASPIALVPVVMYNDYNVLGLFMIVLPLLLIRYSYLSKIQLEEANRDLLRVLVKAIETRDPYTSGHSVRVSTLARQVAIDLQLRHGIVQDVEIAALLHDIGKIEPAYADLIKKPHDLDVGERELIRTHATRGADILASLTSVKREVIEAVRFHHEKYDGTGYPNGLVGERIPVAARIIMLCDSVDAMLSDRPYRKALTVEQTRSELVKYSGSQFDPLIVDTVLSKNTLEKALGLVAESARDSAAPEETQPAMVVMASAG